jgi:hypothetical protein
VQFFYNRPFSFSQDRVLHSLESQAVEVISVFVDDFFLVFPGVESNGPVSSEHSVFCLSAAVLHTVLHKTPVIAIIFSPYFLESI